MPRGSPCKVLGRNFVVARVTFSVPRHACHGASLARQHADAIVESRPASETDSASGAGHLQRSDADADNFGELVAGSAALHKVGNLRESFGRVFDASPEIRRRRFVVAVRWRQVLLVHGRPSHLYGSAFT